MTEFYDNLEIRSTEERETQTLQKIHTVLDSAKNRTKYFSEKLEGWGVADIKTSRDLQNLPLTRKSDLLESQKQNPQIRVCPKTVGKKSASFL